MPVNDQRHFKRTPTLTVNHKIIRSLIGKRCNGW